MKTKQKILSAGLLVSFLLASTVPALAQLPALYGNRTNRITSKCNLIFPGPMPAIPPPTAVDANCPTVPTIAKSSSGRWSVDISWFDPLFQKYYLADRNSFGVDVINTGTEQVVGVAGGFVGQNCVPSFDCSVNPAVANTGGPNGVLTTHNPNLLWAGDGDGTVKVWSLDASGMPTAPLATVNAGGARRADEMAWDPDDQLVLVAWDDDLDLFVAFISVTTQTVVGKISIPEALGCGIEQPVYDHHLKLFFLAVPCTDVHTNGEIAVINPKTKALQTVFGTLDGTNCFPHGLALGPRDELLVGCSQDAPAGNHAMQTIIMSAVDGTKIQAFSQVGGSDEVWYNPGDNRYYLAASGWTSTGITGGTSKPSLGIIDAGTFPGGASFIQNISTTRTTHSVAAGYDCAGNKLKPCKPVNNRVFMPLTVQTGTSTVALDSGGIGVYGVIP